MNQEGHKTRSSIRAHQEEREDQGRSNERAEEIAARTVNKEKARKGKSKSG